MQDIILTAIGTGAVFSFAQFLITRHDDKDGVKQKLATLEKDTLRTQLLLLMLMRPQERQEILTIGEHYFKVLKGNWYMTSMFKKWLKENGIEEPEWFN